MYDPRLIADGEVWRLFTPIFLHATLWHLACNMLVLYWTGIRLEDRYGAKEFLAFYLLAGVSANALDPDLAISWPIRIDPSDRSLISEKDAALPRFAELAIVESSRER